MTKQVIQIGNVNWVNIPFKINFDAHIMFGKIWVYEFICDFLNITNRMMNKLVWKKSILGPQNIAAENRGKSLGYNFCIILYLTFIRDMCQKSFGCFGSTFFRIREMCVLVKSWEVWAHWKKFWMSYTKSIPMICQNFLKNLRESHQDPGIYHH